MISVITSEAVANGVTGEAISRTSLASLSSILGEVSLRTGVQTSSIDQKVATVTGNA